MKYYIFDPQWLTDETESVKQSLKKTKPEADFAVFASGVVYGILQKNPLWYRTYGPYWWALKKVLIKHGFVIGNTDGNDEMAMIYCGQDDEQTIVAADTFSKDTIANHVVTNNLYWLDGGDEPYILYDDDMESLV